MAPVTFRRAAEADLAAIVGLLAEDTLGHTREAPELPLDKRYAAAFAVISADPQQMLVVGDRAGVVIACLQLSFLPGLSRLGAWRGQIEAVRVASGARGDGVGRAMILWAVEVCRARGCVLVQLTTDVRRKDAHRFYARLGFAASHVGMKLDLESGGVSAT